MHKHFCLNTECPDLVRVWKVALRGRDSNTQRILNLDTSILSNFRPVSNLSTMPKLLERVCQSSGWNHTSALLVIGTFYNQLTAKPRTRRRYVRFSITSL